MRLLALMVAVASGGCASSEKHAGPDLEAPSRRAWAPVEFGSERLELIPVDPKVESRLTSEEVLEALRAREDRLLKCFGREVHLEPERGGVVFEWSIDAEGVTSAPRVVQASSFPAPDLVNCMRGSLRLQFPVHRGAALLVRHHLTVTAVAPETDGGA